MFSENSAFQRWAVYLGQPTAEETVAHRMYQELEVDPTACPSWMWPLVHQRFSSTQWKQHVESCITRAFLTPRTYFACLDDQVARVQTFADALPLLSMEISALPVVAPKYESLRKTLCTALTLIRTQKINDPAQLSLVPVLTEQLPGLNPLSCFLDRQSEWLHLPYTLPVLQQLFTEAEKDPRFAPGTPGELKLAHAAFNTGFERDIIGNADDDYDRTLWDKITAFTEQAGLNRFWRCYQLSLFYHCSAAMPNTWEYLQKLAKTMAGVMSPWDKTIFMHIAATNSEIGHLMYHNLEAAATHGSAATCPKGTLTDFFLRLRPDWAEPATVWSALDLDDLTWVESGMTFDRMAGAQAHALPPGILSDTPHCG